jgi:hypothetical protein
MLTHSLGDTNSSCRSLAAAGLACLDELKRRKYKKRLGGRHTICLQISRALTTDDVVVVVTPRCAICFGAAVADWNPWNSATLHLAPGETVLVLPSHSGRRCCDRLCTTAEWQLPHSQHVPFPARSSSPVISSPSLWSRLPLCPSPAFAQAQLRWLGEEQH